MYKNHFSLIWKPQGVGFNKAIEELKLKFKIVDNIISDTQVKSYNKVEHKP